MKIDSKFVSKTGDFIADNKKPLIYIGSAIAVVVIGYAIINKLKIGVGGLFSDKTTGAGKFIPLVIDSTKVTISDAQANAYANQLFNAMKNAGTNDSIISSIFDKINKKDDFLKVYNAFGKKSHAYWGEPTLINYIFGYDEYDLVEWLQAEVGYSNPILWSTIKKTVNNAGLAL